MSNQLQTKAATLAQLLSQNRLLKTAEQEIEHKELLDQTNLGKEQTKEIHENIDGVLADTPEASNDSQEGVQEIVGAQPLNTDAEQALKNTGTAVDTITPDGNATGTPEEQVKSASLYRTQLAGIINAMNKKAAADNFRTGTEVLQKFASLTANSTEADIKEAQEDLIKLASTNPVFHICRDRIIMQKMAEDIQALAEAEGIPEEQAAEELQAAADANPEMVEDLENEADGEAVAELAGAEQATDELMSGIDEMAANASANLGTEVTPDDIISAAEETSQLAEQLGVPPEALIEAAMEEIQSGEGGEGEAEVTPEDEANAQAILDEAAANGISPEEVIQMAAEELQGGEAEAAPAEDAEGAEEPAAEATDTEAEEEPVEKAASLQKRAGTTRAAFVQELRHRRW